jgi:hypothetical protein
MLKKVLKWSGLSILVLIVLLAIAPFLFKDKIKAKIAETINKNVNAKVKFEDVGLNLFSSFPNANVSLDKFSIINKAPFEGDTLVYSDKLELKMSMTELFNDENEPIKIQSIATENTKLNILMNKDGVGNYDIALKKLDEKQEDKANKPFSLSIQDYKVDNLKFTFKNEASNMKMVLDSIYHAGNGNFEKDVLDLNTKTTANLTFDKDQNNFMRNVKISLDAVLGIDLKNSKYTFKENKAKINQLELAFNGFIQKLENSQVYDLTFNTPSSDFKNFLALIPEQYAGKIADVETTGKFEVKGNVKGELTENKIPTFNLQMLSNDASFHYKSLPKTVKNITINTKIINETGGTNDTFVDLNKLSFTIDQDVFNANAHIKNLSVNPAVNAELKGVINLANLSKAYPIKLEKPLNGILKADIKTAFDMKAVENKQYESIKNSGNLTLTGFNYSGPEMAKPVAISLADLSFTNSRITLNKMAAKTGKSDMVLSGTLDNFYGFLFKNQILKGNFKANSSLFAVADFMAPSTKTSAEGKKTTETVKIPNFLDCTITANATSVLYDNLNLKNVNGTLIIKDEAVKLNKLKMGVFGGNIGLTGLVSTKGKTPIFDMNLGLSTVDIAQTFSMLNTLKTITPIADVIAGKLNSTIKLNGNLTKDMIPDIKSINGDMIGSIISGALKKDNSAMLTSLTSNLNFINLKDINLKDVKAALSFSNGKVNIKPFTIKHKDISVQIVGSHGFDQAMDYNLKFNVPAKYLGSDANKLLDKLTPAQANKIENVPVNALLSGSFLKPNVKTDIKQATTNLATQLVKMQKEKYINKGVDALGGLLGGGKKKDSTKTPKDQVKDEIKNQAGNLLNGLFKKKKE